MAEVKEQFYEIIIGGVKLEEAYLRTISEIIYEDNAMGSSLLHISMQDPDRDFIENEFLIEDTPVVFLGGWRGEVTEFKGWISVIDMDFPENGVPTLTLRCMDNSHLLNREKKKRTFEKIRVSDVARKVFQENGLKAVVDTTPIVEESLSQNEQTDIQFLLSLVSNVIEDYICYIEKDTGYFVKKNIIQNPQSTLEYRKGRGELKSFSPRLAKEVKQERADNSNISAETGTTVADTSTKGGNLMGIEFGSTQYVDGRWEVFEKSKGVVRQKNRSEVTGVWKPLIK
jgi:hypothetical protein